MRKEPAVFHVNGRTYEVLVEANLTLLDLLRDRLGLTGIPFTIQLIDDFTLASETYRSTPTFKW